MKPKIIIAGLAQNCSQYLSSVLENIEKFNSIASQVEYIFVENDSEDNTKEIISDWLDSDKSHELINLDGLKHLPIRTLRLESARNTYIELIKYKKDFFVEYDYLVILDMDDVNTSPLNLEELIKVFNFLNSSMDIGAVFANQLGTYYDMWALRHPTICPNDVWEEVFDWSVRYQASDEKAYANTLHKRKISIDPTSGPIEVDSAFGGLGIYKMSYVLNNPNPYLGSKVKVLIDEEGTLKFHRWQVCEHVHFNRGIKNQGGRLFIFPSLINNINQGITFPSSTFRYLLF